MRPPCSTSSQSRSALKQRSLVTSKRGSWPRCPRSRTFHRPLGARTLGSSQWDKSMPSSPLLVASLAVVRHLPHTRRRTATACRTCFRHPVVSSCNGALRMARNWRLAGTETAASSRGCPLPGCVCPLSGGSRTADSKASAQPASDGPKAVPVGLVRPPTGNAASRPLSLEVHALHV